MNSAPTPFDIINPTAPALVVSAEVWIAFIVVMLLAWAGIWMIQRNRKRKNVTSRRNVSPLVAQLKDLLQRYETSGNREILHLFVRTLRRYPDLNSAETAPLLRSLEKERFAPSLSPRINDYMKEVLSILSVHGRETHE